MKKAGIQAHIIITMEKELTEQETREYLNNENCDVDNGMEYLNGLETEDGKYSLEYIKRFVNR